jgi:hypothetical protein
MALPDCDIVWIVTAILMFVNTLFLLHGWFPREEFEHGSAFFSI